MVVVISRPSGHRACQPAAGAEPLVDQANKSLAPSTPNASLRNIRERETRHHLNGIEAE